MGRWFRIMIMQVIAVVEKKIELVEKRQQY
jgi:hypothetical protein